MLIHLPIIQCRDLNSWPIDHEPLGRPWLQAWLMFHFNLVEQGEDEQPRAEEWDWDWGSAAAAGVVGVVYGEQQRDRDQLADACGKAQRGRKENTSSEFKSFISFRWDLV